jgi:hypothetical protein
LDSGGPIGPFFWRGIGGEQLPGIEKSGLLAKVLNFRHEVIVGKVSAHREFGIAGNNGDVAVGGRMMLSGLSVSVVGFWKWMRGVFRAPYDMEQPPAMAIKAGLNGVDAFDDGSGICRITPAFVSAPDVGQPVENLGTAIHLLLKEPLRFEGRPEALDVAIRGKHECGCGTAVTR